MTVDDRNRWDARHAVAGVGTPAPPDALRGRCDLLPAVGRALDVACGRGVVAAWLAQRGFAVDAVDVSPVALASAAALDADVRWVLADLDAGLPADCAGPYDVVVCQRFRGRGLYPALARALAPGGLLVVTVLSEVDDGPGPYRAVAGELAAAFDGLLDTVAHEEGNGEATLIARRPALMRDGAPGSPPAPPARS